MNTGSQSAGSGCGYPNMFVSQTPVFDNAVKKGRMKKRKKKKSY